MGALRFAYSAYATLRRPRQFDSAFRLYVTLKCKLSRGRKRQLTNEGHTTLLETVSRYLEDIGSAKRGNPEEAKRELQRFVQRLGPGSSLRNVQPSAISEYSDTVTGNGTRPQAAERLQEVRKFLTFAYKKNFIETNLAHHVRVRRARGVKQSVGAAQEEQDITLTAEGHVQLVNELDGLKDKRGQLEIDIQRARADGDIRENAPLEAAREESGRVISRIREIESILNNAVVMDAYDPTRSQIVKLGSVVVVRAKDTERESKYTVVSASEANPLESKISDSSPLGKELMGRTAGYEVSVNAPRGVMTYTIVSIS